MLKRIGHRYHQLGLYMIFGFLAALVNIGAFWLLHTQLSRHYLFSNTVAWILATLFSFYATKRVVFKAKSESFWHWLVSFGSFMLTRLVSYFVDTGIMFVGITLLRWDPLLVKVLDQLLVGIFNYGTSKIIFMEQNQRMLKLSRTKQHPSND